MAACRFLKNCRQFTLQALFCFFIHLENVVCSGTSHLGTIQSRRLWNPGLLTMLCECIPCTMNGANLPVIICARSGYTDSFGFKTLKNAMSFSAVRLFAYLDTVTWAFRLSKRLSWAGCCSLLWLSSLLETSHSATCWTLQCTIVGVRKSPSDASACPFRAAGCHHLVQAQGCSCMLPNVNAVVLRQCDYLWHEPSYMKPPATLMPKNGEKLCVYTERLLCIPALSRQGRSCAFSLCIHRHVPQVWREQHVVTDLHSRPANAILEKKTQTFLSISIWFKDQIEYTTVQFSIQNSLIFT